MIGDLAPPLNTVFLLIRLFAVIRQRSLAACHLAGLVFNALRLLELAAEGGNNRVTIIGDVQMEVKPLQSRRRLPVYRLYGMCRISF